MTPSPIGRMPRAALCIAAVAALLAGCGGNGTGTDSPATASDNTPTKRALALALNPAGWVSIAQPTDALLQGLAIPATAPTQGMWSAVGAWPMNGLHQAVLPDGKVLTWGTTPDGNAQNGRYFDVWDPNRGLFDAGAHTTTYDPARQDSFCAAATYLPNGQLLITGGNGNVTSVAYNPGNGAMPSAGNVADSRWYATMVTLADGRPIILGGITPYTEGQWNNVAGALTEGLSSMTPEVYENGAWRTLLNAQSRTAWGPDFLRASMPKAWLAPDGRVFGVSTDQMWYVDANAAGGQGTTTIVGGWKAAPSGAFTNDNAPNAGPTSTGVMYAPGRVLMVGGNAYHNGLGFAGSRQATVIDLNGGGAVRTEQPLMAFGRHYPGAVVLPDGKVVVTGGETRANNDPAFGAYAAEMWNPATGTWARMASSTVFRGYHSQAGLLPNGTVLVTGGGTPGPVQLRGDVFYPPYLFRTVGGAAQLAPRPRLVGLSGLRHANGAQLQFDLASTDAIREAVLIGLSVGTHSFNSGQRRIPMAFTQDRFRITATVPGNTLVPPGYYQLVAVDANGVPSVGTVIGVGAGVAAPAVPTTPYTPPDTGTGGAATPPAGAVACAAEGQICSLPSGSTATVWFGADTRWVSRTDVTGSLACTVATFGDPAPGTAKSCVAVTTGTPPPPPPAGGGTPVGSWNFDAASGTTAPDSSAGNRPLTLANTTLVAGRNGGQAVQFNGANASGSTAGPVLDTAGSFSVATWVRMDALTGWRTMVNQDGAIVSGFWLQYSEFVGSKFLLSMHDADTGSSAPLRAVGTTTPVVGRWYHVVGVRDRTAGTMRLYVDGRLEATTAYTGGWAANGSFNIGRGRFGGPNDWLAGALDDVQAFSTALTDAQVAALYNGASTGPITIAAIAAPPINAGGTATYTVAAQAGATYSWDFGDGTPATPFSATASITRAFANPGVFAVTLTARDAVGRTTTRTFLQAVGTPAAPGRPTASSAVALEARSGAAARLWVANPDSNTVAVIDTATNARVAEVAVGTSPRSVAVAPDGRIWVTNKGASTISIVSPTSLAVVATVALPTAAQPHGLVFAQGGSAFVVLEATGQLLKLDPATGAMQATLGVGANPRHVSASADGALLLVSRFITNPLPGEGTATVDTSSAGAEVVAVNAGPMTPNRTIVLRHSDRVDNEIQGAGIPNYLAAAAISPDGTRAWVPSKQDNIRRGTLRRGQPLDFQNTVRAISSRIDMATLAEDAASRIDHDNASLGTAAAYHPSGAYLFVALETSRQVAVVDAFRGRELFKFDVGRAPQALAVSADGNRLYVQNFMDRTASVIDLGPLVREGLPQFPAIATVGTTGAERLSAQVLLGKQLFYDARDPRLARDSYMSCASCHSDAGHDGRTWDFTNLGEGLRNTPSLKGRGGMAQGFVHWSANFDEIQDFEGQIRAFAGGTGLMSDAQFNTGSRSQPLGDRKSGISADLDALAAYLASLNSVDNSPLRNPDGTLTAAAVAGSSVFASANCASCHGGTGFSNSADAGAMRNIGTIRPASGTRLSAALTGLDVPTLRDVWSTGPYLHDGSAPTLAAAVQAHNGNTVAGTDLANLVAYLQQIGAQEATAPGTAAPPVGNGSGLTGSYFPNPDLAGTAVLTRTEVPWFDWGVGAPAANIAADNFSVRWTGQVQAVEAGSYQFRTNSDDGVRVWVNGVLLINNWTVHAPTIDTSGPIALAAGQRVSIVVEFQEFGGGAVLQLSWLRPGGAWVQIPAAQLYPAAGALNQAPTVALTGPAAGTSVAAGTAITLTASAADADGSVARVEFYAGGTLLGTDTAAPYSLGWTPPTAGAVALTARAFDNAGAATTSAAVTINVAAPASAPPPAAVTCAAEGGSCTLPAGATATVWYGANTSWAVRTGVTGSIACTNAVFGDPLVGTAKACRYLVTSAPPVNLAPTVALTAPANNASVVQGTVVTLTATAADSDGSVARVEFYDGATLLGTDTTAPFAVSWSGAAVGTRGLTARAVDNAGATTTSAVVTLNVTAAAGTLPAGALAEWSFDASSGADSSGNGRTLTLGAGTSITTAGRAGAALVTNGPGSPAGASTTAPLVNTAGSFSVSGWIRFNQLPTCWNQILASQDGVTVSGFYLGIVPPCGGGLPRATFSMLSADADASVTYRITDTATITTGTWYHLVAVRDAVANTMTLYVNGRVAGTVANPSKWAANGAFAVGRAKFSGGLRDPAYAAIDGVRAYGRALTPAEVAALLQAAR